ncbi:periplasmic chaperone for outer membrane proteins SurA [Devosia lucknowensis]|uniref:Periplasmic chaperone for outer membrane proteins SurA n=1 Tax=Devosia lucknowensis TaxID=1096929 RepID=A0A1Y6EI97_9HYPH|nr:SurA N-terminal domain-containing protein [Devosia lucknowensis]SMQ62338.1 periplasmic chaperone for outer membrane proteins SurA [Devosia lucknowensis]
MTFADLRRSCGAMFIGLALSLTPVVPAFAATIVTVNGEPISDVQVDQRLRLFRMEGNSTGRDGALKQLIDEAIQLQEAKRLGINVSNAQVDEAFLQISRNLNVSRDRLTQMLQQGGVSGTTLQDRLRAAIAWNGVTETAVVPQVQVSELELDQQAAAQLSDFQNFDYILKEVTFVGGSRSGQANQYRSSFAGCDTAVDLSLAYNDVAVVDIGRRHATQLPDAIAKELAGLNVGGISKPRAVANGLSMLAVCQKVQAQDLTFVKGGLRDEAGGEAVTSQAASYLERLRSEAKIIYQ